MSVSTKSYYDLYQKRDRFFEDYEKLMIVTFDPSKADKVVESIDDTGVAKVTRLTREQVYKGHQKDSVGSFEAKELQSDPYVHLDVNHYYGFARVEVLKRNMIDETMAELSNQGIITGWMFAQKEIFFTKGNISPGKKSPPCYFIPGSFTVRLKDNPGLVPQTFFTDHSIEQFKAKKTPRVFLAGIPSDITGQNDRERLFKTIPRFNGTNPQEQTPQLPDPNNENAEPQFASFHDMLSPLADPTDSSYASYQWALKSTFAGCNVKGAWGRDRDKPTANAGPIRLGHPNVIVAVVDTGCDLNHQDFSDSILPADPAGSPSPTWNPSTTTYHPTSSGADDYDSGSHGTNVSAVIAAHTSYQPNSTGTASLGIAGIAPRCFVMPVKVDLYAGTADDRADAITFVSDRAAFANTTRRYIMNLSWKFDSDSSLIRAAIAQAITNNVLVVCAAADAASSTTPGVEVGDWVGGSDVIWPASYSDLIPIVAMNSNGTKRTDSNFRNNVSVFAPGNNIRTYNNNSNTTYYKAKTSMAAAVMSGIAALAWSYNCERNFETTGTPNFSINANAGSVPTLRGILTTVNGGGSVGALRNDIGNLPAQGRGRVDALLALNAIPNAQP